MLKRFLPFGKVGIQNCYINRRYYSNFKMETFFLPDTSQVLKIDNFLTTSEILNFLMPMDDFDTLLKKRFDKIYYNVFRDFMFGEFNEYLAKKSKRQGIPAQNHKEFAPRLTLLYAIGQDRTLQILSDDNDSVVRTIPFPSNSVLALIGEDFHENYKYTTKRLPLAFIPQDRWTFTSLYS